MGWFLLAAVLFGALLPACDDGASSAGDAEVDLGGGDLGADDAAAEVLPDGAAGDFDPGDEDADAAAEADCFHPESAIWRVCDGRLHDPDGRHVLLRGVNVSQARKHSPYEGGTSAAELLAIRDFGFNHVRLLWSWAAAMPAEGVLDDDYLDRVAAEVAALEEAGLLVVLDSHQDLFGEAIRTEERTVGNGAPAWACPAEIAETFTEPVEPWFANYAHEAVQGCFDHLLGDSDLQNHFAAAWAALAGRVADSPAVIGYDLWNEPFWGSHNLFTWEEDVLLPLYERLGAAVLAVDPDAVLFVEPGANKNVSGQSQLPRPSFAAVAFAPHLYVASMEGGAAWNGDLEPLEDRLVQDRAELDAWGDAALYIGEWGTPGSNSASDAAFLTDVAGFFDAEQVSWCVWQLGPGAPGSYALVDAELAPHAHALGLARPYPERVAGDELAFEWEPEAGQLTVSWRARRTDIATVIAAPPLAFPDGYEVDVSGGQQLASHDASRIQVLADGANARVDVIVTRP